MEDETRISRRASLVKLGGLLAGPCQVPQWQRDSSPVSGLVPIDLLVFRGDSLSTGDYGYEVEAVDGKRLVAALAPSGKVPPEHDMNAAAAAGQAAVALRPVGIPTSDSYSSPSWLSTCRISPSLTASARVVKTARTAPAA